ncbi:MAG: MlaA family lipoprotein [Verrucomicrobiia bacterium]
MVVKNLRAISRSANKGASKRAACLDLDQRGVGLEGIAHRETLHWITPLVGFMLSGMERRFAQSRIGKMSGLAALACFLAIETVGHAVDQRGTNLLDEPDEVVVLPESIPDPLEPMNRAIWAVNESLLTRVVQPSAKAYRFVVRKPIRTGISNFGRNIRYPGRVVNHLLQARWGGARDETYRFGLNSVLGLGGIFDVASGWDIPQSDADFGQTLGKWGWRPSVYLMLPLIGPSSERDALGLAADTAANPLAYWSPVSESKSLSYQNPYTYVGYTVLYNDLTDRVDDYARLVEGQKDAYTGLRYVWGFARKGAVPDFTPAGPPDRATFETIQSAFASFQSPEFARRARMESALVFTTGYRLEFSYWLQPSGAPIVFIVPGLGSHRLSAAAIGLAEMLHAQGFSVACVSNPFNYEFIERASTAPIPGYTRLDAQDLHVALTVIDQRLQKLHPGKIQGKALLGYSMGGFQSLALVANGLDHKAGLTRFDRLIAINPPVRLLYGASKLDDFLQAPLAWPREERARNMENTFLKIAGLLQGTYVPDGPLQFSEIESKFLIGSAFRLILSDLIFAVHEKEPLPALSHPVRQFSRRALYREIMRYSFDDYFEKLVVPAFASRNIGSDVKQALAEAGDLRSYTGALKTDRSIRVILNRNDFLLSDSDLAWLNATLGPDRLTAFEHGGHLGNLLQPEMREAILEALDELRPQTEPAPQ